MKQQRRTHAAINGDDAPEHDDVITARMQLLHDAVDPAQRTRNVRCRPVLARRSTSRPEGRGGAATHGYFRASLHGGHVSQLNVTAQSVCPPQLAKHVLEAF